MLQGFTVSNLPGDSNNTYTLDAYGKIYTFDINCTKHYGWWTYDLKLQHPNGSIDTNQVETFAPLALNYDVHVQYHMAELDTILDVDIYTTLLPLSATFQSSNPSDETLLVFSEISGSSTALFDLVLYAATEAEIEAMESNTDLALQLFHAAGELFSWTWEAVLSFVGLIPYVGGDLVTALIIASYLIDETFYYFNLFFIDFIEATIISLEFFIIAYSIHSTRSKSPIKLFKNTVSNHISVIEFIFAKAESAIHLLMSIIKTIASIVDALKPT